MAEPTYCEILAKLAREPQDQRSWESLWHLVQVRWFSSAYAIVRSTDRADDAIQNAMLYIRDHAGDFTAPSSGNAEAACQAWLMRIVCNSALQLKRSDSRHEKRNVDHGGAMHQSEQEDPAEAITQSDLLQVIRQYESQLSDAHQSSLALFYAADLSYEECAATMSCTVNNARVRVHRALKALRKLLTRAGISCSVWSISNALSAQQIPLHLSTIEATSYAQLPSESSAIGALDASLPTGGLSLMAKLSISAAIAASLTFGPFGLNQIYAEDRIPAPKQVEQKKDKSIQTAKQWMQAWIDCDIDTLIKNSQIPFRWDATFYVDSEDELRECFELVEKRSGQSWGNFKIANESTLTSISRAEVEQLIGKRSKNTVSIPARTNIVEITLSKQGDTNANNKRILVFIDPNTNKCLGATDI